MLVDARPQLEGQVMLKRLIKHGIPCTYVLLNAISCIMAVSSYLLKREHPSLVLACSKEHECVWPDSGAAFRFDLLFCTLAVLEIARFSVLKCSAMKVARHLDLV